MGKNKKTTGGGRKPSKALSYDELILLPLSELERMLEPRQIKFVEQLDRGCTQTDAAIAAGYSERSAHNQATRLMKNDAVLAYRYARNSLILKQLGASPESVLVMAVNGIRRCMQAEPVLEWDSNAKEWVPSGEYRFDSTGAAKLMDVFCKATGMYEHAKTVQLQGGGIEELVRRLRDEGGGLKY